MNKILKIIFRMMIGFFFCAISTTMAIKSNLGLSPWDVFHQGVSKVTGITIGQANIITGIIIVIIVSVLGLKIGIGTLLNMVMIGLFVDLINYIDIIPFSSNMQYSLALMVGSMFFNALGIYLYIGSEMGCGPRDGLMVVLSKITSKSVGIVRFFMEAFALITGYFLGGTVGLGTLIIVFGLGYFIQLVCRMFKLNIKDLNHKNIKDGLIFFKKCLTKDI